MKKILFLSLLVLSSIAIEFKLKADDREEERYERRGSQSKHKHHHFNPSHGG